MRIATSWATSESARDAVKGAYERLVTSLGAAPSYLVLHAAIPHPLQEIAEALREHAPGIVVHGGTSCLGVMTEQGFHSDSGKGLGMLGIWDPDGAYGTASAAADKDPVGAAVAATHEAISCAGRPGETPDMLWITGAPGHEERVISALSSVVGPNVPIAGGSAADNDVSGRWGQFSSTSVHQQGIVVSALYPSQKAVFSFHSGYDPTGVSARVTKGGGRRIDELDGEKAALVYSRWLGGALDDVVETGGNILARTTLRPLGRVAGHVGDIPYHLLIHPDSVTALGGLTLFADVLEGEELYLMSGSEQSLVLRAGRVARSAVEQSASASPKVLGALVIYCAGCMLAIRERMPDVARSVSAGLGGAPFLGAFTFGEQGCFIGGQNRHGNLMISVLAFVE